MKALALISGGMDSVTAAYIAAQDHELAGGISFNYGSKHNPRELPCARWHCEALGVPHRVIDLDFMAREFRSDLLQGGGQIPEGHYEEETMRRTVVPFRNGIMLAIAAGLAESLGAEALVIAAHSGDHAIYPDCRANFMDAQAEAIRLGTYAGIRLLRPFVSLTKADIVRLGAELGVDFSRTWSCYVGGPEHCGACGTCVERREAFTLARIPDPTSYARKDPLPPKPAPSAP